MPAAPTHLPAPAAVPLIVSPALPGEGQWKASGPIVNGSPAMYVAQYRADTTYTGQITTAVWIDPTVLHVRLVPGAQEPGGTWAEPPNLTGVAAAAAVAAFNGGFRFGDAHGGFCFDGRTRRRLRPGAASMVIYDTGSLDIGRWGSQVTMTPQVHAVLQNLVPLVDNGQVASNASYSDTHLWGSTLGANTVVARSGIGVTATGALLYVAGPALTARSLAESLQRAGAVRAMALGINPERVTFNLYDHPDPANPAQITPSKLYPSNDPPGHPLSRSHQGIAGLLHHLDHLTSRATNSTTSPRRHRGTNANGESIRLCGPLGPELGARIRRTSCRRHRLRLLWLWAS